MISLLAWGFVVENLVFGLLPSVGRFLPVHAANAMMGFTTQHYLSGIAGVVVLLVWTAALGSIGMTLLKGRDVN